VSAALPRDAAGAVADDIAGVVVNYNARQHLLSCVESLIGEGIAVTVVDNGSADGSERALRERFPHVGWLATGANLGYGAAANLGAARLPGGTHLLVCNPDVIVRPGAVDSLRRRLASDLRVGVLGPRITNADGSLYPSARRFPSLPDALGHAFVGQIWKSNPFSRRYMMAGWDHADAREVDWVSGSCMLVRRAAWDAIGGFDTTFFMYLEDVDLCWRVRREGWSVGYEPSADVLHLQGVSADLHPYRMLVAHHASMWRFAWRTTPVDRRWVLPLVFVGLVARLGLTVARRALASPPARFRRASAPPPAR